MIELENVSLKFGALTVLENVDLHIGAGESLVLIGPSGAGKSVILKLMAGLISPTAGVIRVEGKDLSTLRGIERTELLQRMGMLFQKNALFDSLTVSENVGFPLVETTNLEVSEVDGRVDKFLEAVGLDHASALYPDEISGGMQKRLGIARALALHPEIIYYDDPTAGLDPITSRRIIHLILELKRKSKSTIVAITNEMNRAYQMADRIAMVVDKGIIVTGNVEETKVFDDERVQQFIRGDLKGPLTALA